MKSPKPSPKSKAKPQDQQLSPQERLDAATQDYQKWSAVASKPGLSPTAAAWASQAARSAKAEMNLRQKASEQQPDPAQADPNLAALLGMPPSPQGPSNP